VLIRQVQITHHAKRRFVRDADIADLARPLALGQRFQRVENSDAWRGFGPLVAQLAKAVSWALRPVNLVEIEIVGLQAFQAGVQRFTDIFAIQHLVLANAAVVIAAWPAHLGGDNQLFTVAVPGQPVADVGFG